MSEGVKFDNGKMRMDLIPAEMIEALATILTHGAKKYDDNNWMKGLSFRRVWGALIRHLMSYRRGEYIDPESGYPHLWHAFCNLGFLIYYNVDNNYGRYTIYNDFLEEWAQNNISKGGLDVESLIPESVPHPEGGLNGCYNCYYLEFPLSETPCGICGMADEPSEWRPK